VTRACSAWGARATQAVVWRCKAPRACSGRARGSTRVRGTTHTSARLRAGARLSRRKALVWRCKGGAGSSVEAQGRRGLAALGVRGCEAWPARGSGRAGTHGLH
jgi:hypothetical protein